MMNFIVIASIVLALTVPRIAVASTIAYNNLGPNDSYSFFGFWIGTVNNGGVISSNEMAAEFTSSASGTLDSLVLGLVNGAGNNNINLYLMSDAGGVIGNILWCETFTNQLPSNNSSALYLNQLNGPMLNAGSAYWLIADALPNSTQSWYHDNTGIGGPIAQRSIGSGWSYSNDPGSLAMRIEVNEAAPVPEPGSMILLGIGSLGLAVYGKRRRHA